MTVAHLVRSAEGLDTTNHAGVGSCEHQIAASRASADVLVASCARVRILATGRGVTRRRRISSTRRFAVDGELVVVSILGIVHGKQEWRPHSAQTKRSAGGSMTRSRVANVWQDDQSRPVPTNDTQRVCAVQRRVALREAPAGSLR